MLESYFSYGGVLKRLVVVRSAARWIASRNIFSRLVTSERRQDLPEPNCAL